MRLIDILTFGLTTFLAAGPVIITPPTNEPDWPRKSDRRPLREALDEAAKPQDFYGDTGAEIFGAKTNIRQSPPTPRDVNKVVDALEMHRQFMRSRRQELADAEVQELELLTELDNVTRGIMEQAQNLRNHFLPAIEFDRPEKIDPDPLLVANLQAPALLERTEEIPNAQP